MSKNDRAQLKEQIKMLLHQNESFQNRKVISRLQMMKLSHPTIYNECISEQI